MASCKDCLCYEVCEARITADENYSERNYTENNNCNNFKDRNWFVEVPSTNLPINIYLTDDIDNTYILRDYFYQHNKSDNGKFMMVIYCIEKHKYLNRELSEYGRTMFLTRKEAERALEERA